MCISPFQHKIAQIDCFQYAWYILHFTVPIPQFTERGIYNWYSPRKREPNARRESEIRCFKRKRASPAQHATLATKSKSNQV